MPEYPEIIIHFSHRFLAYFVVREVSIVSIVIVVIGYIGVDIGVSSRVGSSEGRGKRWTTIGRSRRRRRIRGRSTSYDGRRRRRIGGAWSTASYRWRRWVDGRWSTSFDGLSRKRRREWSTRSTSLHFSVRFRRYRTLTTRNHRSCVRIRIYLWSLFLPE